MTKRVELDVAQATLRDIVAGLGPDDEVVIVVGRKEIARIRGPANKRPRREPGLLRDAITVVADDDDHLQDFADYMP